MLFVLTLGVLSMLNCAIYMQLFIPDLKSTFISHSMQIFYKDEDIFGYSCLCIHGNTHHSVQVCYDDDVWQRWGFKRYWIKKHSTVNFVHSSLKFDDFVYVSMTTLTTVGLIGGICTVYSTVTDRVETYTPCSTQALELILWTCWYNKHVEAFS